MMIRNLVLPVLAALLLPAFLNAETAVTDNGDINSGATWTNGLAPVAGDMQQWDTGALTLRTGTQTWEGQELRVQTDGRLATGGPGPTLTMNGDLTLDGGTVTSLNNNPFTIDLQGNNFTLNSGLIASGRTTTTRNIIFANALLQGSGTIFIEGGFQTPVTGRTTVTFEDTVDTSGFTGTFNVDRTARFFMPEIAAADASFGIEVQGSGQIGLTNNIAVTSAVFDGNRVVPPGTYTRTELLALDFDGTNINPNRVLSAGATGTLTVVPSGGAILGDFNNDLVVDLADLDRYNGNIGAEATGDLEALDLNNDGTVGADDFAQHYTDLVETSNGVKGTFAGDINLDGVVDVLGDAFALVGNLGNNSATSWSQGDLNADGVVDVLGDAFALVANLGNSNE